MLGKLIKHDFKAISRLLLIFHAFYLLMVVIMRFTVTARMENMISSSISSAPSAFQITVLVATYIAFFILLMGLSYGTAIIIVMRFYRNLFTDQAYLTRTLPVTAGQHLLSKTIVGFVWSLANTVISIIGAMIVLAPGKEFTDFWNTIVSELAAMGYGVEVRWTNILIWLVITIIAGSFNGVAMYYGCVAIGQLFQKHRVLAAIITYFVITTVTSLVAFVVSFSSSMRMTSRIIEMGETQVNLVMSEYILNLLIWSSVAAILIGAGFYVVSYFIMKKRINVQ
jgi:hypothetical protein